MMDLGFPGGPIIEQIAKSGDAERFEYPKPLYSKKNCDLSFSGLKTAVKLKINSLGVLSKQDMSDIAASFQKTVCDVIRRKSKFAMSEYESLYDGKRIVVAGGVVAN